MTRPDYAFQTSQLTVYLEKIPRSEKTPRSEKGGERFRLEPGGEEMTLSLAAQHIPASVRSEELERAVAAWVIARGGRTLNLGDGPRPITPMELDRPPAHQAKRLVSIAPSNAEILGALGATDRLVGVDNGSDYPPEVRQLTRLGPELNVDMAALEALHPELVLASLTVPGMERNITALESAGLAYLVLAPRSLRDIREDVTRVARALGMEEQGAALARSMELRDRAFSTRRRQGAPVRVYLEWWPKPMFSPGGSCWSNEVIQRAGGTNVFEEIPTQSGEVTMEQVVAADPEVIFISWCGVPREKLDPKRVLAREGLGGVSAVKNGRVYAIDEALLGRPGPRIMDGLSLMAETLQDL